jgi:BirA family biotin operon repressor/biotin-[acetyl-CoA-carboxylase] ligase
LISDSFIDPEPELPPIYRAVSIARGSAFAHALDLALDGEAEAGTLVWTRQRDCLDCAIVLEPDQTLEASLPVSYVALLGLADALGSLGPPNIPVTFGWPDRIEVNGASVGGVRLVAAESRGAAEPVADWAIPHWLVLGVSIQVHGFPDDDSPGLRADRTALHEEGFGEVEAIPLLESFSRHFLAWMNTWQDDGFDRVRDAWLARASEFDGEIALKVGGEDRTGIFTGIDGAGALLLGAQDGVGRVGLGEALREPSWALGNGDSGGTVK